MIVVGVDFSEDSRAALRWAVAEGRMLRSPVLALHAGHPVYEPLRDSPVARERRAELLPALSAFVDDVDPAAGREVTDGPAWEALVERSEDAELAVVGRHGLGAVGRTVLGSVSHDVVRHARCPVAVVPRAAAADVARVVVGTDGSDNAAAAMRWAAAEAVRRRVPLLLVHASPMGGVEYLYDEDATRAFVEDVVAKVRHDVGGAVEVTTSVSWKSPAMAILDAAGDDSLVVVGSRGRGAVARVLLGSTSAVVIEESAGAAVVVPLTH